MRIVIDYGRCIGSGMCTGIAPDLFELDDDAKLTVLIERPPEDRRAAVEAAVMCCPVEAVSTSDD